MNKLDIKNLQIGKMYFSFDDGKRSPSRLCFIKIKDKLENGYIVDVEWGNEIVAKNEIMCFKNGRLMSLGDYGGVLDSETYGMVDWLVANNFIKSEETIPKILKDGIDGNKTFEVRVNVWRQCTEVRTVRASNYNEAVEVVAKDLGDRFIETKDCLEI